MKFLITLLFPICLIGQPEIKKDTVEVVMLLTQDHKVWLETGYYTSNQTWRVYKKGLFGRVAVKPRQSVKLVAVFKHD